MDECKHLLPLDQCADCRPTPRPTSPVRSGVATMQPQFRTGPLVKIAVYDGTCSDCGEGIEAGVDEITMNDSNEWVHTDC